MEHELIQILREEILDTDDDIRPDTDLFEAGLDSMAIMRLQLAIEDRFGIAIDPADLSRENFGTVGKLAGLIRSKHA